MDYGAMYIKWAPFAAENPEPAGRLPTYGPAVSLGPLNKVTDNPSFNEAKGYGDNSLQVYVNKFKETVLAVENWRWIPCPPSRAPPLRRGRIRICGSETRIRRPTAASGSL